MKTNRPPILLSGLILGLFGLGNLTAVYHDFFYHFFNILALLLYLYLTAALLKDLRSYREEFGKAPLLSSFATYPMAAMLLAAYLSRLSPAFVLISQALWYLALVLHLFLIIYFSWTFVIQTRANLTPSWTVLYVGIAMAGLTNAVVNQPIIGGLSILFGLLASLILYPLLYLQARKGELSATLKPQWAIYCAPFSLLLGAYNRLTGSEAAAGLLLTGLAFSQAFYLLVLVLLPRILSLGFQPTWSALTFPLVNTALALQLTVEALGWPQLIWPAHLEAALGTIAVATVCFHYGRNLFIQQDKQKNPI